MAPALTRPDATGVVASLAHPGGQVTGLVYLQPEQYAKRVELLKQAAPGIARVTYVEDAQFPPPFRDAVWAAQQEAAAKLGIGAQRELVTDDGSLAAVTSIGSCQSGP